MATVLIIGDPHFKVSAIQQVRKFIEWLHTIVLDRKPDFVVNLGDTFHTHNVIRSEIMAVVAAHVKWMEKYTEYYILVGNHDMAHHKTPEIHAWLPFIGIYDMAHIIAQPLSGNGLGFLPYIDDPEVFEQNLRSFAEKGVKTVFCHQTFIGANYGFMTSPDGVAIPDWYDGEIVSGHVHKEQQLGPVWYPGTPYAQEATDNNMTKGIYLYDTVSRAKELIVSPMPRWITVKIAPSGFTEAVMRMNREDRNHIVLQGASAEVNALLASREFQDAKKSVGFSVKKELNDGAFQSRTVKRTASLQDAVVEYVDRIYDGTVDKNRLKEKCLSALK